MTTEESFLPVVRVIALALSCDGPPPAPEAAWLEPVMTTHGLTAAERAVVAADAINPPNLMEVFKSISIFDLERIPRFIETALGVDGRLTPRETEFYRRCLDLVAQFTPRPPTPDPLANARAQVADELVAYADREMMWGMLVKGASDAQRDPRWWRWRWLFYGSRF